MSSMKPYLGPSPESRFRGPHSTILLPSFSDWSPGYQLVMTCLSFPPRCELLRGGIVTYFTVEFPTHSKKPAPSTVQQNKGLPNKSMNK